jgi:hypothetical protein
MISSIAPSSGTHQRNSSLREYFLSFFSGQCSSIDIYDTDYHLLSSFFQPFQVVTLSPLWIRTMSSPSVQRGRIVKYSYVSNVGDNTFFCTRQSWVPSCSSRPSTMAVGPPRLFLTINSYGGNMTVEYLIYQRMAIKTVHPRSDSLECRQCCWCNPALLLVWIAWRCSNMNSFSFFQIGSSVMR